MLIAWFVFPLLLGLLALGCGLLVEVVADVRLPGPLVLPTGLALIIAIAQFTTMTDATAELTTPAAVAGAVAGFVLSPRLRDRRLDRWAVGLAVAVFVCSGLPVLLSGEPTFAGFIKLDDTATWLSMVDRVMEHGHSLSGLAPSSYEATLSSYLAAGYPVGAFLPLGVGAQLTAHDPAWLFQPYMSVLIAALALVLYQLCATLVPSRPARALIAFVASQSALLIGYALWGGVKEVTAAWLIALFAALALVLARDPVKVRKAFPLAVATAAALAALSFGGVVWLWLPSLAIAMAIARRDGLRRAAWYGAGFLALAAILSIPSLVTAKTFLNPGSAGVLTKGSELGNLIHPLNVFQVFGIWPSGDFRVTPHEMGLTDALIAVTALLGVAGLIGAWRRRAWEFATYVLAAAVGCALIVAFGSPWVDGKALATASPAFLLAALGGVAWIFRNGRKVEAAIVGVVIVAGVAWSDVLAFHDVYLAPHAQLAELEQIGKRVSGEGPTLMTEYAPYGVRHFLRDADPEGASELRRRIVPLRAGGSLEKGAFADIDQFDLSGLMTYRTFVLRRSPTASRPPLPYQLTWSGHYYEVWQKPDGPAPEVIEHQPLGDALDPAGRVGCDQVLALARRAGPNGRLAYVKRTKPVVIELARFAHPPGWQPLAGNPGVLLPDDPGTLDAGFVAKAGARYDVWVGGSFRGRVQVFVDGKSVASARDRLNYAGQYEPLGDVTLSPGVHRFTLRYTKSGWYPGSGEPAFGLGPVVLAPAATDRAVQYVRPSDARQLCNRRFDWIEALG